MVIGIILVAAALAVYAYVVLYDKHSLLASAAILFFSSFGTSMFIESRMESDIERLEQKVAELQQVIGPGYATDDGIYNPNDIFYAYADSTGVTLNLESTSFYWHGSYSDAFRIMELLSNPQELTEEGSRYYQYLVSDVMASEAMKQRK